MPTGSTTFFVSYAMYLTTFLEDFTPYNENLLAFVKNMFTMQKQGKETREFNIVQTSGQKH